MGFLALIVIIAVFAIVAGALIYRNNKTKADAAVESAEDFYKKMGGK